MGAIDSRSHNAAGRVLDAIVWDCAVPLTRTTGLLPGISSLKKNCWPRRAELVGCFSLRAARRPNYPSVLYYVKRSRLPDCFQ